MKLDGQTIMVTGGVIALGILIGYTSKRNREAQIKKFSEKKAWEPSEPMSKGPVAPDEPHIMGPPLHYIPPTPIAVRFGELLSDLPMKPNEKRTVASGYKLNPLMPPIMAPMPRQIYYF